MQTILYYRKLPGNQFTEDKQNYLMNDARGSLSTHIDGILSHS